MIKSRHSVVHVQGRVAALLLACWLAIPSHAATLIQAGHLIDGVSNRAADNVTIVVEGNRITAIDAGFRSAGAQDQVVDLRNATVLPGLMDMHVHLTEEANPGYELARYKEISI